MRNKLYICQKEPEQSRENNVFCINRELWDLTQQKKKEIFSEYMSLTLSEKYGINKYEIISQYFALERYGSIQDSIFLYDKLKNRIREKNVSEIIVSDDVEKKYQLVVKDVVETGVSVEMKEKARVSTFGGILQTIFRLIYILFEQLLHSLFKDKDNDTTDIIFILNRPDSMVPVIESAKENGINYKTISPKPKIKSFCNNNKIADVNINDFMTFRIWLKQVKFYFNFIYVVFITSEFSNELTEKFKSELGREMPNTIGYATNEIFLSNKAESFRYAFLMESVLNSINCEKVVVSSLSASGRSVLQMAEKKGIDTYHIPHSIITPNFNSIGNTQHFICGKLDLKYLRDSLQVPDMSKYIPSGRPHFYDLHNNWVSNKSETDEMIITVATQPISNKHEFIQEIVNAAEKVQKDIKIEIKIHPGEEKKEYEKYMNYNNEKITVVDDKLFQRISRSDLVITRNSNVGLEAMIVGTPCVAVNWWRPFQNDMSYIIYGPVPVCEQKEDIHKLFNSLNGNYLSNLEQKQTEFIQEHVELSEDPSDRIIKVLNS